MEWTYKYEIEKKKILRKIKFFLLLNVAGGLIWRETNFLALDKEKIYDR